MGRIPRWRMGHGVYHVYNRSLSGLHILENGEDKSYFLKLLGEKLSKFNLNVYHYCIMGNHFHLAIEALDIRELSSFMSGLSSSYSKYFRGKYRAGYGPLWQGRYKSILVQKDEYLFKLGRYIELNPVRANLVNSVIDWQWSSAKSYVTEYSDSIVDITKHPFYLTNDDFIQEYKNYLQENSDDDLHIFRSDVTVIGDDKFKGSVLSVGSRKQIRRGRPRMTNN